MKDLTKIAETIEELAIIKFGSVNKMLKENDLSISVIANMKRQVPSILNIKTFCKIAKILDVSVDYLLNDCDNYPNLTKVITKEISLKLSIDEKNLLNLYRKTTDDGKTLIQETVTEIWAKNQRPKNKLSQSQTEDEITVTKQMA